MLLYLGHELNRVNAELQLPGTPYQIVSGSFKILSLLRESLKLKSVSKRNAQLIIIRTLI